MTESVCSSGHPIAPGQWFCPACGERVADVVPHPEGSVGGDSTDGGKAGMERLLAERWFAPVVGGAVLLLVGVIALVGILRGTDESATGESVSSPVVSFPPPSVSAVSDSEKCYRILVELIQEAEATPDRYSYFMYEIGSADPMFSPFTRMYNMFQSNASASGTDRAAEMLQADLALGCQPNGALLRSAYMQGKIR